jgi:hypothetical protein
MKPISLGPVVFRTCVAAAACLAFLPQTMTAAIPQPVEHLVARSVDATGTYAGPVDVVIARWSTDEEVEAMRKPLVGKIGPAAVLAMLEKVRVPVGYVLTPGIQATGDRARGRRSWTIDFAREAVTKDGRRVVVAAQDHMPIGEFPKASARGTEHRVDVLDMRFNREGKGVGRLADVTRIAFNKKINSIEIAKYEAAPLRLKNVEKDPTPKQPVRTVVP